MTKWYVKRMEIAPIIQQTTRAMREYNISNQDTVVTANQRQYIETFREYKQKAQLSDQQTIMDLPTILPLSSWLSALSQAVQLPSRILSTHQEKLLWRQIIAADEQWRGLQVDATAAQVQQAWRLCHQHGVDPFSWPSYSDENTACWQRWCRHFIAIGTSQDCISEAMLVSRLLPLLSRLKEYHQRRIVFYGFDELTPAVQQIASSLQQQWQTEIIQLTSPATKTSHCCYTETLTETEEIRAAAQFAHQHYQRNPTHRVAIVTPKLTQQHTLIRQIFADTFYPDEAWQLQSNINCCYNLSASHPITHSPATQVLLALLQATWTNQIDLNHSHQWLTSPFINLNCAEIELASAIDAQLKKGLSQTISLTQWLQALTHHTSPLAPSLSQRIQSILAWRRTLSHTATLSEWSEHFFQAIQLWQWPGGFELDSASYQLVQRLILSLDELADLSFVQVDPVSATTAINEWRLLLSATTFQPEGSDTPIQILGQLEAAGLPFDAIWWMHLDSETWPAKPSPNPFIPIAIQRQYNLPHCSAEREYQFSQQLQQQLMANTSQLIVSFHQQSGDRECRPSPLITTWKSTSVEHLVPDSLKRSALTALLRPDPITQAWQDDHAPAFIIPPSVTHGGSQLLALQAQCPFRASTQLRLRPRLLTLADWGLQAFEKGNLVHQVLQALWTKFKSLRGLIKLTPEALADELNAMIEQALSGLRAQRQGNLPPLLETVEQQRLFALLSRWLQQEKQRTDFDIEVLEHNYNVDVGPLTLNITVDRIDQMASGERVVIDYKTGKMSPQSWLQSRLPAPQMPLYACYDYQQQAIAAIAIASLHPQQMNYRGLIADEAAEAFPPLKTLSQSHAEHTDWHQQQHVWRQQLETLADAFVQGQAQVDPASPTACAYCDLQPFCRIQHVN